MLTAMLLLTGIASWGQQCYIASIDLSEQGYDNAQDLDGVPIAVNQVVTLTFYKGTNTNNGPKYYNVGTAVRCYGGNYFTVTTSSGYISAITLTFGSGDGSNEITTDVGTFESPTWTGNNATVNFTISGTSGQRRIKALEINYCTDGGQQQTVATPTFSPAGGTYTEQQTVSISCATDGATIHYTTNGNEPTESSATYYNPLDINETTTVKAKAFKSGYTASAVATATYTFPTIVTIAEARALEVNEYVMVQGLVNFIDNRNVYIQDATGGICLYLNSNTVPSALALGDMVQAFGKRANYNGLKELSNIDGSNADEFAILSSGNTLPIAVKTIAEINEGGAEALQCTRVKIEDATIGTINTNGNTPLTQGGNSTNIYKVPALTGIEEGDEVDVVGVVGYYNAAQIRVANASDVTLHITLNPELNVSVTSLSGFAYIYGSGPSAAQSFTVTGSNLSANVTLTAPSPFEIATSGGTYSSTLTLTPTEGTVNESINVRMVAGLNVGDYSGNLSIVSGSLNESLALSGTVNEMLVAATPVFSPNGGNYLGTQNVTISTTTQNATIYYTTDGTDPTTSSTVYSGPITMSATTTLKAMAAATGYANSEIASATFTINAPITIAEARALANNQYAAVEGTVIFIDGRNVYIQDETAGIDLYLNSGTVPSGLALGDKVCAYGRKTAYNGLVELTGINGNSADAFIVVSTGNALPLANKTIAEINADFNGDNLLQATRVRLENVTVGTVNPNGTTVISQDGANLNVYHIPVVEGLAEGDIVNMTGIVSCYNTPQLRVVSANDIEIADHPYLAASVYSLSGLTYAYSDGGPSNIVGFELSGNNLIDNVSVFPSESFEVSTFGGDLFHAEDPAMVINQGNFYGIKIYVRMKANLEPGTYNEQIFAVSEGADTLFINVSGTVTGGAPTPPPATGDYVRISDLSQLVDGSLVVFAARFDGNATDYYAMSNQSSGKPTGVLFTSTNAGDNEILPATIVDEESSYYWTVAATANGYTFTNADGELIGYSSSTNFATGGDNTEWSIELGTAGDEAMVPGYTGFVINNVNNAVRCFALNSNHNFGPYHTNNINASGYNFYLDLFVKTEGTEPPTPVVATPTFTPEGGTYFEAQTVTISCTTEGSTIHYTLDGTNPSESSPVYTTPLMIETSTTVKAIAMKEGYDDSNIATATYTIQTGFVTIFNQDWEGEMNGWTFVDVEGEAQWSVAQYSGNHYAYANGYNHGANEDWCISPAFNLDAIGNPVLTFRTAKNYNGPDLQVFFSNDYDDEDPTNATWIPLTCALSQGSWTWTESGDIDLSAFSGTNCYIGFKYTCEESSAAGWEVDDIQLVGQTSEAVVTVTPLTLTGFTYIEGNGPSAEQSFTVSGLNLSGNVTITDAPDFEISLTSGNDFNAQSSITLTPANGNIEETTVYVRLIAGLTVGQYNDEVISITSEVDDFEVTCSGTVTAQPVPGDDYVRIAGVSELMDGNRVVFAARFDENATDYYAMSNTASGKPEGVLFTSALNGSDEILPASIIGEEDNFYWTVNVTADGYTFTNAAGDMIGYTSSTNFAPNGDNTAWSIEIGTSEATAMVPNYTGFVISNVNNPVRAFALNGNHNFGPYHTQNMAGENYNFFLDIFMQGEGGTCTVAAPTFTPEGGTYYEAQEVTLNCTTPDATIWYSPISENGPWTPYTEAILVDEFASIWAYAEKEGCNDSPVVNATYVIQDDLVIIFNQDWEDDWNGWTEVNVEGDSLWRIASYQGNHYAYANGYNHPATEDWLISPAFDLDSYSDVVLTFRTAMNYNGPDLEVYFSNDYDGQDPTAATWQELECELSGGSWNWVESGEIYLDGFSGSNCYIAFKYTCTGDEAAGWEVDDIMLVSGGVSTEPYLIATPNALSGFVHIIDEGPSEVQTFVLTGGNLPPVPGGTTGSVTLEVDNMSFELSLDGETFNYHVTVYDVVGTLEPTTVYVRLNGDQIGAYEGIITIEDYVTTSVSLAGEVLSADQPAIRDAFMPLYIQGNNGSNNNRVPVAIAVYLENLEPNTTYRYTNQFVDDNDGPETAGAGNVIYANPDGFYRSTNPSLSTEGGYGEFTADAFGEAMVWFVNEPTANARFTPGNHVYLRIRINDGHDGTTAAHTFTTEDYATVLNFGTEYGEYQGTAFYAKSNEAPMTFAMMYATIIDWRPVYSTPVETTGVDYGSINQYADFYKDEVAGKEGWFGGILPNDNEIGINMIVVFDMTHYWFQDYYVEDGQWKPEANTVNPNGGLNEPIFIDLTYDGVEEQQAETNLKVWSADHEFVIENGENEHYQMTVFNVLGQPMMQRQINAGSTERISHSLANGLYVINLRNDKNTVSVKVIVR